MDSSLDNCTLERILELRDVMSSKIDAQKHRSYKAYTTTEDIAELIEIIQKTKKAMKAGPRIQLPDRALMEECFSHWPEGSKDAFKNVGCDCCHGRQHERLTVEAPTIIIRYDPDPLGRRSCIEDVPSKMHRRLVMSIVLLYLCIQIDAQDNSDQTPTSAPILSLTMATLSLSFPVVRKDTRSSAVLLFATYLGSLLATTAYGYVCFPNVGDCQMAVLLTVTLSTFGTLLVFIASQEGTEAALTFLPLVLSLSAFIVGNLPAIKKYAVGLLRGIWSLSQIAVHSLWEYLGIKIKLWREAMGTYLVRIGRRMQNSPQTSCTDLEAGGVQPRSCTTGVTRVGD